VSPQRRAEPGFAAGRRARAVQFLTAADEIMELADDGEDIGDAYVTLCVHAGIAAADTLTAHRLQVHNVGDNHHVAIGLLRQVQPEGPDLATHLAALLALKTKAGYTHRPVSAHERLQAGRRAFTSSSSTSARPGPHGLTGDPRSRRRCRCECWCRGR
jgi:hypothetical protein